MNAFILDRYGRADRVRAGDMPNPELREDDVLVQVHAAGVNLLDSKIRNGEFKLILPYHLPLILGHDVADDPQNSASRNELKGDVPFMADDVGVVPWGI
jgi:NADPH:quinone reductase-like Zn-dependent oxidoreductase